MALPSRPLAIMDATGTTRSIARAVDGNVTGDKSLETLGDSAFGAGAHAMSDFEGYSGAKELRYCRFASAGSCGSSGPVTVCDCVYSTPAMVLGDGFDATFCYILNNTSCTPRTCAEIRCNDLIVFSCLWTSTGVRNGTWVVNNVAYNTPLVACVYACTNQVGEVGCAITCLASVAGCCGSDFVVCANSNFVIATNA